MNNINPPKPYIHFSIPKSMTLIIGMKYKDGVILIGDRKVVEGAKFRWEDKIFTPFTDLDSTYIKDTGFTKNIAIAGSGWTDLIHQFAERISGLARGRIEDCKNLNRKDLLVAGINPEDVAKGIIKRNPQYQYKMFQGTFIGFMDDCATNVKQLIEQIQGYLGKYNQDNLAIMVGAYTDKPFLATAMFSGFIQEHIKGYASIGSGTTYAQHFLDINYKENMSLEECIKLAVFAIKYCEKFQLGENGIGLKEGTLPQIVTITKDGCTEIKLDATQIKKYLDEAGKKINSIETHLKI